jgi:predicted permease
MAIDLISAARALTKRPGAAILAISILAFGIAVNAAVFAVVRAAVFKGFAHVERNDRLVQIATTRGFIYYPDFDAWRTRAMAFEDIALVRGVFHTFSDGDRAPDTYFTTEVTANTFRLLGVVPFLGRDFSPADAQPGAEPVVVLRYDLWERTFEADRAVIGRTIRIDGRAARIVGVMPRDFTFPSTQQLWMPLVPTPAALERQTGFAQFAYARLRDDSSLQRARAEMDAIGTALATEYPRTNRGMTPVLKAFDEWFVSRSAKVLYETVWTAAAFVLLVIGANVANLLMERAVSRSREIAIRFALGASAWRVTRQLVVEALMLSTAGTLLGWPLGRAILTFFESARAASPDVLTVTMDAYVLAFVVPLGIAAAILASIGAALYSARLDVNGTLTNRTDAVAGASRRQSLSDLFVATQVVVAVVLLTSAGAFLRSYRALASADVGAEMTGVLTMSLYASPQRYGTGEAQRRFYRLVAEQLDGLPGVTAVGFGTASPTEFTPQADYVVEGEAATDRTGRPPVAQFVVSPTYFRTLRVTVVAGREFDESDRPTTPPVAIVNQQFASQHWPRQTAIGRRVRLAPPGKEPGEWLTIVGIVANVIQNDRARQTFGPIVYLPYSQLPQPNMFAFVRTSSEPEHLVASIRRTLYAIDPDFPVPALGTLDARFARTYAVEWQSAFVVVCFAAITVVIATIGLYAAVARSVSSRAREIAIRRAIGANGTDIAALICTRVAVVVGIGWLVGLMLAGGLLRIARTLTLGVWIADSSVVLATMAILAMSAALGCTIPAVRATRVDPAAALRGD